MKIKDLKICHKNSCSTCPIRKKCKKEIHKQTSKDIKKIIQSKEFKDGIFETTKLLSCVIKICENKNPYALESLKNIIDKRINNLNIQAWFNHINFN